MLKIVGIIVAIVVVGIAGILAFAATKPDTFRVQRAASIKAPPEKIFPLLNDLRSFATLVALREEGPGDEAHLQRCAERQGGGVRVGRRQERRQRTSGDCGLLSAVQGHARTWTCSRPLEAHNIVEFTLEPKGESTNVTWAMNGQVPYIAKIVHVFLNVDKMVGQDFEAGLANLKAIAEK